MNIEPEIQDANDAVALTDVKGTIDFENVSFQYKDNQEKVLNRINLHVPAGAYMALVGSSGAGHNNGIFHFHSAKKRRHRPALARVPYRQSD